MAHLFMIGQPEIVNFQFSMATLVITGRVNNVAQFTIHYCMADHPATSMLKLLISAVSPGC